VTHLEAQDRADTFVPHAFEECVVDLGEIRMNYATAGEEPTQPAHVKVPVLFTHHWHQRDQETDIDQGAISDLQAFRVRELVTEAGQDFTYLSFPDMPHSCSRQPRSPGRSWQSAPTR